MEDDSGDLKGACPVCNTVLSHMRSFSEQSPPCPGDILLCPCCLEVLVFDESLVLSEATIEQIVSLDEDLRQHVSILRQQAIDASEVRWLLFMNEVGEDTIINPFGPVHRDQVESIVNKTLQRGIARYVVEMICRPNREHIQRVLEEEGGIVDIAATLQIWMGNPISSTVAEA